jgi:hypothetical protein
MELMLSSISRRSLFISIILLMSACAAAAHADDSGIQLSNIPNNGQDFSRPPPEFDLRYQYQRLPHKGNEDIFTFRTQVPFQLSKEWIFGTRLDVPLGTGNTVAGDNPTGRWQFMMRDLLNSAYLAWLPNDIFSFFAGSQFIWPTASFDQGGQGKYQILPFAGFRYFLHKISPGSFILPWVQYATDYAGSASRPSIMQVLLAPSLNINLPRDYFIELYSSQSIIYDFEAHGWEVPCNFMVGKVFNRKVIVSAEFFIPMFRTNKYEPYDFKVEFRAGYFF